jgi:DNA polymerase III subunit gamma/tau
MSLATKYRPRRFEDLAGQDHVVATIRGMLQTGRINQTLLIFGPWGSGKTTTARLIARHLNCTAPDRTFADEPCGTCNSCRYGADVEEINAASVGGIETIRKVIARAEMQPISGGKYNIFVLDEAHQLTPQAVQALLKITEEPPRNCMFVLCTTDPQRFPPALSSRCVKLDIRKVTPEVAANILSRIVEGEQLDRTIYTDEVLMALAVATDGHPRDAITALEAVTARVAATNLTSIDNIPNFVIEVVREEVGERPEAMVVQYLISIYRARYTPAIAVLQRVSRHGSFIDHVMRFHAQTLYYTFGKKLRELDYGPWYRQLDELFPDRPDDAMMADLMDLFVQTSGRLNWYQTDGYYDMLNVTMKAVRLCRTNQS